MVLYSGQHGKGERLCRSGWLAINYDWPVTTLVEIELLRWSSNHETKQQQQNTNTNFVKMRQLL